MQEEKIAKVDMPNTKDGVLNLATLIFRFTRGRMELCMRKLKNVIICDENSGFELPHPTSVGWGSSSTRFKSKA